MPLVGPHTTPALGAGARVEGVRFHAESVLTDAGEALMRNFLGVPAQRDE